jgi:hypothetical protein
MGCYMARNGVLHDFGSYHESTWASGIRGVHACLSIPLEGIITALYCSRTDIYGVDDVAYSIFSHERSCYMILEVGIAQYRLWGHVIAYGAHTCMHIPLEGIITALYCSRIAI